MLLSLGGDAGAYRLLLSALSARLRTYYCRKLGRDSSDTEDLVQETLIAMHERRMSFDRTQPLTAWVYAIARYKLIVFVISAVYASVSGSLLALMNRFVTPDVAGFLHSIELVTMTVYIPNPGPPVLADPATAQKWIAELGNDNFKVRERAAKELAALGTSAAGLFREALRGIDRVIRAHVEVVANRIGRTREPFEQSRFIRGKPDTRIVRRRRLRDHAGQPQVSEVHVLDRRQSRGGQVVELAHTILNERAIRFPPHVRVGEQTRQHLIDPHPLSAGTIAPLHLDGPFFEIDPVILVNRLIMDSTADTHLRVR